MIKNNHGKIQTVFRQKPEKSPCGSRDFSADSLLQAVCGSLLQLHGLRLDLRKTFLMRNAGYTVEPNWPYVAKCVKHQNPGHQSAMKPG